VRLVPSGDAPTLHPDLTSIAFVLGRWAGEGEGEYPTVKSFGYGEEITFSHLGKAFVAYTQRSWHLEDGRPLHSEMGYLRCPSPGKVELVVAHPTGHAEISEGTVSGTSISLSSVTVVGTTSAKEVLELARHVEVSGEQLRYELKMAAVGTELRRHLRASLRRVAGR
jgi:hypothetical protein